MKWQIHHFISKGTIYYIIYYSSCTWIFFPFLLQMNSLSDLTPCLLACEAVVAASHNWRLQELFLRQLSCLSRCFPSEEIYNNYCPVLLRKLHTAVSDLQFIPIFQYPNGAVSAYSRFSLSLTLVMLCPYIFFINNNIFHSFEAGNCVSNSSFK